MTSKEANQARKQANEALFLMGKKYWDGTPITKIDEILYRAGFNVTEEAIYCGREGRSQEFVGENTWISLSWYKMPSGRYEITAYVSGGTK